MTVTALPLPHTDSPDERPRRARLTENPVVLPRADLDEDVRIAARLVAGDEQALREAWTRYGGLIYSTAYRIVGDHQLAEECTQDVFVALWTRADRFDARRGRLSTWLLAITRNRAVELTRRRAVRRADVLADVEVPGSADDPADLAIRTEQAYVLARALVSLPAPQSEALRLAFVDGLTHSEIAARLGLPLGTVKGRLRLGLERLSSIVDPSLRAAA